MSTREDELSWGNAVVETVCPLDCPDCCSLDITLERGRVVKIDGSHQNPVTGGYICAKVRRFADRLYGEDRLLTPAIRTGAKGSGTYRRVSWDEALDLIATRMRDARDQYGAESVLPFYYGGSNGLLSQDTTDAELFRRFGASRLERTVCAAPTGAANKALYGKMPSVSYQDYVHAKLIVMWGANPPASGIHLVPYVHDAQRRGAKLVVIDPRRTGLAKRADLHLALQPGTDVIVALAVHRYLFENGFADETFLDAYTLHADRLRERAAPWTIHRAAVEAGIEPEALEAFAKMYAEASPALIRCGWGLERNRNGGNGVMAVLSLPAVGGKFGVRGGGYAMSNSAAWNLTASWIKAAETQTRLINMNHLGRALLDYDAPPVKVLFVYNCNPVATIPDQNRVIKGLQRDDLFTVVFDQVMTDTAAYADVLLPATTFLETYDVAKAYGPISLQLGRPAIDTVGEARPNVEVFSDLGARLELNAQTEDEAETLLRVLGDMPQPIRETLLAKGTAEPPHDGTPIQFVDVFPRTPGAKVDLFPEDLEAEAPDGLYRFQPDPATGQYPLTLISPASEKTISSTLGELRIKPAAIHIHPTDAAARNIEDEDIVRVFNDLGEIHCPVVVNADLRPGTVSLPKGLWRKSTLNGFTANALVPDTLTDLARGACFNDARVEIAKMLTAKIGDQSVALWTK